MFLTAEKGCYFCPSGVFMILRCHCSQIRARKIIQNKNKHSLQLPLPVHWDTQIANLAQVIHAVQHGKDLFGMPHKVWENIINVS